jgi:hypothetical protein
VFRCARRRGGQTHSHVDHRAVAGRGELTGNLAEQVCHPGVLRENRGGQLGHPVVAGGNQARDELAADPAALPGVFDQYAQFGRAVAGRNEGGQGHHCTGLTPYSQEAGGRVGQHGSQVGSRHVPHRGVEAGYARCQRAAFPHRRDSGQVTLGRRNEPAALGVPGRLCYLHSRNYPGSRLAMSGRNPTMISRHTVVVSWLARTLSRLLSPPNAHGVSCRRSYSGNAR